MEVRHLHLPRLNKARIMNVGLGEGKRGIVLSDEEAEF